MDMDINEMFQSKNKEIFKNSLILEMERNIESLKNTTENAISLETNKLLLFFKSFLAENNIEYKKEELIGFLFREKTKINNLVNDKIDLKKDNLEKYLKEEDKRAILDEEFLEEYYKKLSEETNILSDNIEIVIKTEIYTEFSGEIIKKFSLSTDEQKNRIESRVNTLYKDTLIKRIQDEAKFRDDSLKNMSKESYSKYKDLNKQTLDNN